MEQLKVFEPFTRGRKHDGLPGDFGNRKRGTTSGVTVKLRQDHTGEVDTFVERLSSGHRVLTNHGVNDEKDFVRVHSCTNIGGLLHEYFVNTQTTSRVDDHHVIQLRLRNFHGVAGDLNRVTNTVARFRRIHIRTRTRAHNLQLVHRVWALKVSRHQHGAVPVTLEPVSKLSSQRGLTGTLQTRQHDDGRWLLRKLDPTGLTTQNLHQFVVNDLDDLLARVERLGHFC